MTTQKEKEYADFLIYCIAHSHNAPSIADFDMLNWLHSDERREWQDHKRLLGVKTWRSSRDAIAKAKPALRHYTSAERKGMPVHTGVMLYFPDALAAISRLSKAGNDKHNPGQPLHWERGKSADHSDCEARHMLTPDAIDPETGEAERVAAAWRALADLQLAEEKRLVAAGIMPLSGVIE